MPLTDWEAEAPDAWKAADDALIAAHRQRQRRISEIETTLQAAGLPGYADTVQALEDAKTLLGTLHEDITQALRRLDENPELAKTLLRAARIDALRGSV